MPRRAETTRRKQVADVARQLVLPLVRGALLTRALLREFVLDAGLQTVTALFAEEAAVLGGPKNRRQPGRTAHH